MCRLDFCLIWIISSVCFVDARSPRITEHPMDAIAARDEPLTLNCKAEGRPTPVITWYHDGTPLTPIIDRRVVLPDGSLLFLRVAQSKREHDAGVYWCEARNAAGMAASRNATLQIAVLREDFRTVPADNMAIAGESTLLPCQPPRGVPEPSVLWTKDNRQLDLGGKRLSLIEGGSLLISETRTSDSGVYRCSAQNMVGTRTSLPAKLTVVTPPKIIHAPIDKEVIEGATVEFKCQVTGDPIPEVIWRRTGGDLPVGRSKILPDQSLVVENVKMADQGQYVCEAKNEGGNLSNGAMLNIYSLPKLVEPPSDISVQTGGDVTLPCRAEGAPPPRVFWEREHPQQALPTSQIHEQNWLNENVKTTPESDKQNEGDEQTWEEKRDFTKDEEDVIKQIFIDEQKRELLSKEKIMSLRLKRAGGLNSTVNTDSSKEKREAIKVYDKSEIDTQDIMDPSDPFGKLFTDEQNSDDFDGRIMIPGGAWDGHVAVTSDGGLKISAAQKGNSGQSGYYICTAVNEAGSVSKRIYVNVISYNKSDATDRPTPQTKLDDVITVVIKEIIPLSPSSIKVIWELPNKDHSPIGLNIRYRAVASNSGNFHVSTVENADTLSHTITGLHAHTKYEVFAAPQIGGKASNIKIGTTMEDAPSGPPSDVRVGIINSTAAFVRWAPPSQHTLNGELLGYKIQIKSNTTSKVLGQMTLNATTLSVVINSLAGGRLYSARVAALTRGGAGPYSPPTALHMDPDVMLSKPKTDPTASSSPYWLGGMAIILAGTCLIGGACATIWIRHKRKGDKHKSNYAAREYITDNKTLWVNGNLLTKQIQSPLSSEYAEVNLSSFTAQNGAVQNGGLQQNGVSHPPPEPYATVTLRMNDSERLEIQLDDSGSKSTQNSSEYAVAMENKVQLQGQGQIQGQGPRPPVNFMDLVPPPPDHPYGTFRNGAPTMTIRTNPVPDSPHANRKQSNNPPPVREIPSFPQNWTHRPPINMDRTKYENNIENNENDYEDGSLIYEQCYRPEEDFAQYPNNPEYNPNNMEHFPKHAEPFTINHDHYRAHSDNRSDSFLYNNEHYDDFYHRNVYDSESDSYFIRNPDFYAEFRRSNLEIVENERKHPHEYSTENNKFLFQNEEKCYDKNVKNRSDTHLFGTSNSKSNKDSLNSSKVSDFNLDRFGFNDMDKSMFRSPIVARRQVEYSPTSSDSEMHSKMAAHSRKSRRSRSRSKSNDRKGRFRNS